MGRAAWILVLSLLGLGPEPTELDQAVLDLTLARGVTTSHVGYAGVPSAQHARFEVLRRLASDDQLRGLVQRTGGAARVYAFWALFERPAVDVLPLVFELIDDDTEIWTHAGCVMSRALVGDLVVDRALGRGMSPSSERVLGAEEVERLYRQLIVVPNGLRARALALREVTPDPALRERLLELRSDPMVGADAVLALARLGEVEVVQAALGPRRIDDERAGPLYEAVVQRPDARLWPTLLAHLADDYDDEHYRIEWRYLYRAVAAYRSREAADALHAQLVRLKPLRLRDYYLRYLSDALESEDAEALDEVLLALWSEHGLIQSAGLERLLVRHRARALALVVTSIGDIRQFRAGGDLFSGPRPELIAARMFEVVAEVDRGRSDVLLAQALREARVGLFEELAPLAVATAAPSVWAALFERMATDTNPHVAVAVAEAAAGSGDASLIAQAEAALQSNAELRSSWAYEAALRKLE